MNRAAELDFMRLRRRCGHQGAADCEISGLVLQENIVKFFTSSTRHSNCGRAAAKRTIFSEWQSADARQFAKVPTSEKRRNFTTPVSKVEKTTDRRVPASLKTKKQEPETNNF